ncbi:hypothetical protein [Hydrogenophaga sp. RWCD_12]|uniref:hypothetical protein n=1 Tax=Hydrogenophaga sp. RWCD_12 TaxID=3391190 RepID=UPI0039853445
MRYDYSKNTPSWMKWALGLAALLAIVPVSNLVFLGIRNLRFAYTGEIGLTGLGQLGDFFGGHTAAFAGATSLAVVLFFTFHQARQQSQFFVTQQEDAAKHSQREFFLQGINLITQWDIASPGCDQCLRLLDYYGRVALNSEDRELPLMLNTVITAKIRENLQGQNGSFKRTNYPYAIEVMERIAELRKEDGLASKLKLSGRKDDAT